MDGLRLNGMNHAGSTRCFTLLGYVMKWHPHAIVEFQDEPSTDRESLRLLLGTLLNGAPTGKKMT